MDEVQFSIPSGTRTNAPQPVSDNYEGNLSGQVFELIRQYIITGELRPNQRLVESEIAKRLGISRTPVREALKRLEMAGYVTKLSNGGLIVTEHSPSQIQSLYEIRLALEPMAIKLACQRATVEQIQKAEEYHTRSIEVVRTRDVDRFIELNSAFHETLYSACGNEQLWSLVRTFRYHYFDRQVVRVFTSTDWRSQIMQHGRILEAVRQRNAPRAERALLRHLRTSLRVALERL